MNAGILDVPVAPSAVGRISGLTPADRQALSQKAHAARRLKVAARKSAALRKDFAESDAWDALARMYKVRLPPWGAAITPTGMRLFLHQIKKSVTAYEDWSGEASLETFKRNNPDWPLRAWAGLCLEWHDMLRYNKSIQSTMA